MEVVVLVSGGPIVVRGMVVVSRGAVVVSRAVVVVGSSEVALGSDGVGAVSVGLGNDGVGAVSVGLGNDETATVAGTDVPVTEVAAAGPIVTGRVAADVDVFSPTLVVRSRLVVEVAVVVSRP